MNRLSYVEFMQQVEREYRVQDIRVNGLGIWPFLRNRYWERYRRCESEAPSKSRSRHWRSYVDLLLAFLCLLRNYDYVLFSSMANRKIINGVWEDRFLGPIVKRIGSVRTLSIRKNKRAQPDGHPLRPPDTIFVDSFRLLGKLFTFLFGRSVTTEGSNILEAINRRYAIDVDYQQEMRRFWINYKIKALLLKLVRPKAIFVVCYYDCMDLIRAAKDMNIKVIEAQHGVITAAHPAYNILPDTDRSFLPDYFLAFGKSDVEALAKGHFIPPRNVFPVGSYYIDYILRRDIRLDELSGISDKYPYKVGVTSQTFIEDKLLPFLVDAAMLDPNILYVFISRDNGKEYYDQFDLPENIVILEKYNFYEIIGLMDFHATVFSTCALEAPSLGIQNILIDIDGYARRYFGDVLGNSAVTRYVLSPQELVETLKSSPKLDKESVCRANCAIFEPHYERNISRFLEWIKPIVG